MVKFLWFDAVMVEPNPHIAHQIGKIAADIAQFHNVSHRHRLKMTQRISRLLARSYDLDQPA